jgi:hypothetical protein
MVQPDQPEQQAHKALRQLLQVLLDILVLQVFKVSVDLLVHKDQLVPLVLRVRQVHKVLKAYQFNSLDLYLHTLHFHQLTELLMMRI